MIRITIAAKVKLSTAQSIVVLIMGSVYRITTTIPEMIVIDAIKDAGAIIQGISSANATMDCISNCSPLNSKKFPDISNGLPQMPLFSPVPTNPI
jgi:hypothetical protein